MPPCRGLAGPFLERLDRGRDGLRGDNPSGAPLKHSSGRNDLPHSVSGLRILEPSDAGVGWHRVELDPVPVQNEVDLRFGDAVATEAVPMATPAARDLLVLRLETPGLDLGERRAGTPYIQFMGVGVARGVTAKRAEDPRPGEIEIVRDEHRNTLPASQSTSWSIGLASSSRTFSWRAGPMLGRGLAGRIVASDGAGAAIGAAIRAWPRRGGRALDTRDPEIARDLAARLTPLVAWT